LDHGFLGLQIFDLALKVGDDLLLLPMFGDISLDSPEDVQDGQGQEGDDNDTIDDLVLVLTQETTVSGR